jgi:hypothetical protein
LNGAIYIILEMIIVDGPVKYFYTVICKHHVPSILWQIYIKYKE